VVAQGDDAGVVDPVAAHSFTVGDVPVGVALGRAGGRRRLADAGGTTRQVDSPGGRSDGSSSMPDRYLTRPGRSPTNAGRARVVPPVTTALTAHGRGVN
jgi:hypothetical protein